MDAIALVDGTGRWWNSDYTKDMTNSFCTQIDRSFRGHRQYKRGPSDEGYYFNDKAVVAAKWLAAEKAAGADRLFLAGYSRGAAIVLEAAEMLDKRGVRVDGLFLFDPVVRVPSRGATDSRAIPANVAFSRTAHRSLGAAIVLKYDNTLLQKPYNLLPLATRGEAAVLERTPLLKKIAWMGNPIRPEFGRFIVSPCGPGDHQSKVFVGSHGALGGVGWKDVTEDAGCQSHVAGWMNTAFTVCSLDVRLASQRPTARFDP